MLLFGENGLFKRAKLAGEKYKLAEGEEKEYLEKLASEMNNEKDKTNPMPILKEGDIEFICEPSEKWTNGPVNVTIRKNIEGDYSIEYVISEKPDEEKNWIKYNDSALQMDNNGLIHARIVSTSGKRGNYLTKEISNIDKINPTIPTLEIGTVETDSIEVTARSSDEQSGIVNYKFEYKSDGEDWQTPNDETKGIVTVDNKTECKYKYTGLFSGVTYYLRVTATDAVNLSSTSTEYKQSTVKIAIDKSKSYIGYYADIGDNGSIDGIIYADLALGNKGSGKWGDVNDWGTYSITKVDDTSKLKEYYIKKDKFNGDFGEKEVVALIDEKDERQERFYIMSLSDAGGKGTLYDWYNALSSNMNFPKKVTETEFGKGITNTKNMLQKWGTTEYGVKNNCPDHEDMWGQIPSGENNKWFIPSSAEWSAFAEELKIGTNYSEFNLSERYWTSSQYSTTNAYEASFSRGMILCSAESFQVCVRLSRTF